jgi:transposase
VSTTKDTVNGQGDATAAVEPKVRRTYAQNWPAYNAAQVHEKEMVASLLRDLCDAIEAPAQGRGRPRTPLADAVFAVVMKVYGTTSGRRAQTDLRDFEARGFMHRAPSYNSVFDYLDNPILTPLLQAMIEESAKPLRSVESEFAADSTGFSTAVYRRWYDHKYGREQKIAKWVKAHVMVGVQTNIVTTVEVTPFNVNDYPLLPRLLESTQANFNVARLTADKGYSGRSNIEMARAAGVSAFIPFKSNTRAGAPSPWREAFEFFRDHADEFYQHYHKRSNVETTFSMIKAKFGGFVRSKTPTAQANEVLCKVLAHNLCCLVGAFYELGIAPRFWQDGGAALTVERSPAWNHNLPARTPWTGPRKQKSQVTPKPPADHVADQLGLL